MKQAENSDSSELHHKLVSWNINKRHSQFEGLKLQSRDLNCLDLGIRPTWLHILPSLSLVSYLTFLSFTPLSAKQRIWKKYLTRLLGGENVTCM